MPVYTCVVTENAFDDAMKAAVAAEITRVHSSLTGAPSSFVHVLVQEEPPGSLFTDARPSRPLLVWGYTRAGRADAEKSRLALALSAALSETTNIPEDRILVSIRENSARFVAEGGRILPEPGVEGDWLDVHSGDHAPR